MAHLKPLGLEEVEADIAERFRHYKDTRGFTPNSIMTMARRPNIVRAFMQLNQAVLYEGSVSPELKMLVSLIASQAAGCRYCQAHMANLAKIYKSSGEKIANVWSFETSDLFSSAEKAALRLALHGSLIPNEASADDFKELKDHFSESEIVELVASIALFGYLNRWNDTMATELETLPAEVAENTLAESTEWVAGKHQK